MAHEEKTLDTWLGDDNQLGKDIFNRKYRYRDESFNEWLMRVSGNNEELAQLIADKKFLFGGRVLANRGTDSKCSLANCYTLGRVPDDYAEIMEYAKMMGLTFKGQGGQGVSLTNLRPKGTPIGEDYVSDGIIPFIEVYNMVTTATSQGGARRGALLISLDALHKEAKDFITIKSKSGSIEGANLSLEINDEFMQAVKAYYETGEEITLHRSQVYSGHTVEYDVKPIEVFKLLVDNCYDWGDPGCLFMERFSNYNLLEKDDNYVIECCNPCGEQPLHKHGACSLGSINMSQFVVNPYTSESYFDYDSFEEAVRIGVEALDTLIDEAIPRHPLKQQKEMAENYRNIGLGVFGYADCLIKLGLTYGSDKAIEFTKKALSAMFNKALKSSTEIAKNKGAYPSYDKAVLQSSIIQKYATDDVKALIEKYGLRNCSLLSVAPTGSISTMLGASGGVEPLFALKHKRRTVAATGGEDKIYEVECKTLMEWKAANNGKQEIPPCFITSQEIPWKNRIATQAAMQEYVDTAISSTVNLPQDATKEDIANIYISAWENGLKGITIFRDGCKKLGILTTDKTPKQEAEDSNGHDSQTQTIGALGRGVVADVPSNLNYRKYVIHSGCGKLYMFVGVDEEKGLIYDIFTNTDGTGGCTVNTQALSRSISLLIRADVPMNDILKQLKKSGSCPAYQYSRGKGRALSEGKSCASAMAIKLESLIRELSGVSKKEIPVARPELENPFATFDAAQTVFTSHSPVESDNISIAAKCPECKATEIIYEGGCQSCKQCGWSKCGD
ncbi:MAG: adenosylcobalamin-dependent ribonucleoside-diphosphate reductase [Eubacteriales bacterium]|nr:adenosylcobalamin-dependent ribonucleoside-diphosphate reductase [Eubacteriales bacterium]